MNRVESRMALDALIAKVPAVQHATFSDRIEELRRDHRPSRAHIPDDGLASRCRRDVAVEGQTPRPVRQVRHLLVQRKPHVRRHPGGFVDAAGHGAAKRRPTGIVHRCAVVAADNAVEGRGVCDGKVAQHIGAVGQQDVVELAAILTHPIGCALDIVG